MPRAFFCNTTAALAWRHRPRRSAQPVLETVSTSETSSGPSSTIDMSSSWHADSPGPAMATVARTSLEGSTESLDELAPRAAACAAAQGVSQSRCSVASNLSRTLTTCESRATLANRGATGRREG